MKRAKIMSEKWEAVVKAWPLMEWMEPEQIIEFLKLIEGDLNNSEVFERWFLPRLFNFESVKELFNTLDECKSISALVDTPIKEYLLEIKFTGRERGIPVFHPDFSEFANKDEDK
jgi:hypothetical protein